MESEKGWRGIESIPQDGGQYLLVHKDKKWIRFGWQPKFHAGRWYYSGTNERSQYAQTEGDEPTHWRPIPAPPEAGDV